MSLMSNRINQCTQKITTFFNRSIRDFQSNKCYRFENLVREANMRLAPELFALCNLYIIYIKIIKTGDFFSSL